MMGSKHSAVHQLPLLFISALLSLGPREWRPWSLCATAAMAALDLFFAWAVLSQRRY